MSNTSIQLKKSGQSGNVPSTLTHGEVALNYADGKLYYKNSTNTITFINNQDTFSVINVDGSLILATSTSDTLNLVSGNNVTLQTDVLNNRITISSSSVNSYNENVANAAFVQANAAFDLANTLSSGTVDSYARNTANAAFGQANDAYNTANSAGLYANAAFVQANTPSVTANASFVQANAAYVQANAAYVQANAAFIQANTPSVTANAAFVQANSSYNQANSAYNTANTKFDSSGGTISGDVNITGNLSVTGNTFSTSSTQIVANDTLFIMGTGNYSGDVLDIGFAAHYNNGTNAHTGLMRDSGTKEWQLFEEYTPEIGGNNNIIITDGSFKIATLNANLKSTTIRIKNIDLLPYTNAAFDKANTDVTNISITAGTYGNTTSIPVITLAANGRVSSVSNASLVVATSNYANTAASANFANVANAAVITNVTTGTYYPVITDTTITGAESLNYSSNDFQMYAGNNTFRATGDIWGNTIRVGSSGTPVVNAAGYWTGMPISGSGGGTNLTMKRQRFISYWYLNSTSSAYKNLWSGAWAETGMNNGWLFGPLNPIPNLLGSNFTIAALNSANTANSTYVTNQLLPQMKDNIIVSINGVWQPIQTFQLYLYNSNIYIKTVSRVARTSGSKLYYVDTITFNGNY